MITIIDWITHNAASLTVPVLWLIVYLVRGNGRPKRIAASRKPITLRITIAAGRVRVAFDEKQEDVSSLICIRGPKTEVVAIGDNARAAAKAQRKPLEHVVGILASELWQQLRAWPPGKAVTKAQEIVVFDPFALETLSLAAIDAFLRYEIAVVTQGASLVDRFRLGRGMASLAFETFDELSSEQQLAVVKIVSVHVPTVAVNERDFFRV